MADVTITVDGNKITAPAGTLLIEACKGAGIEIPAFCYYPGLSLQAACRMCVVRQEKVPKLQTACTTQIAEGQVFFTDNQGDWVAASALYHIQEGKFYGHVPPLAWREDFQGKLPVDTPVEELDRMRTRAAVVFPYGEMSNSPTQPLWDNTGGKFGPFAVPFLIQYDADRLGQLREVPR